MIDFSPGLRRDEEPELPLLSPPLNRPTPVSPPARTRVGSEAEDPSFPSVEAVGNPSPAAPLGRRRVSSGGGYQSPSYRRPSDTRSGQARHAKSPGALDMSPSMGEATIRGVSLQFPNRSQRKADLLVLLPFTQSGTFPGIVLEPCTDP
jgi:hypothetical protein